MISYFHVGRSEFVETVKELMLCGQKVYLFIPNFESW